MSEYLDVCRRAAQAAGQVLLDMRGRVHPRAKAPKDLVTEADLASQSLIEEIVLGVFPDHGFLGEEELPASAGGGAATSDGDSEYCWVVDPLDGTLNYVHQLPNYSVSVALRKGRDVIVGTVFDPVLKECFTAERGCGAHLNGKPIQPSLCTQLPEALVAASLPAETPRGSAEVARFVEVLHRAQSIRRLGSAALNLCYVGMGRLDAYWATCIKIWDIAAAQLIHREAGGQLTALDGSSFDLDQPLFVASSTPQLHSHLVSVLDRAVERSTTDGR